MPQNEALDLVSLRTLPQDIFWMVLECLDPSDIVRSRRVCQSWKQAFENSDNLIPLLRKLYPLAREVRALSQDSPHTSPETRDNNHWRKLFDRVACRYHHLSRGTHQSVQKYKLCGDFGITGEREWFRVPPWENHASHLIGHVDIPFSEAFWTYEDGLVVFPSADYSCLVLLDLESDRKFMVPFITTGKVIRRIRLQKRLLVVEWAEPKAFHWLNNSDGVHRHFASSFDVIPDSDSWKITFRNEWKIMFLGHPLSERDRFYSTHSNTHYVIYIWQPNRSLYTADEDAPIESLSIWDISKQSNYRPSLDPTGNIREDQEDKGPSIVSRFSFRELGFYGVRQRGLPGIQGLEITDDAHAVIITENIYTGPHPAPRYIYSEQRTSCVKTTSIPLHGIGPCLSQETNLVYPSYRGNGALQQKPLTFAAYDGPWAVIVSEAVDEEAQVSFCHHLTEKSWPSGFVMHISIRTSFSTATWTDGKLYQITGRGDIFGNESYLLGESRNRELVVFRFDR